ncbi:MAG TPA: FkbM family methyltransferase [Alistipes sp.]|nr:FkbM family methyltransferase [Alistipes sp.]
MTRLLHRILYRLLPLEGYLRAVSRMFFVFQRLGIGRFAPATEYVYHLPQLVRKGDVCMDLGANLGYYTRTLSRLAGPAGCVHAVEPVAPVRKVLSRNLRRCGNVEIYPFALGTENKPVRMGNDSALESGYMGTGQNFVNDTGGKTDVEFTAEMRRGSELFAHLPRLDFVKCDIEGYELIVMREMRPLLERFRPTVLIETGGENRPAIIGLFRAMGYDGFTLDRGREVPLDPDRDNGKDIVFRPRP